MGELKQRGKVWWIRYRRGGRRYEESSGSTKKGVAVDLLRVREGDSTRGIPVTPKVVRLQFSEAAADVVTDYRINGKRSIAEAERRIRLHLAPWFEGKRMSAITTADIRAYVAHRQSATTITRGAYTLTRKDGRVIEVPEQTRAIDGVSNAEINRELTLLKRIFTLAMQSGKLLHKPHIPLLREDNTRTGFFERDQLVSLMAHLPPALRPVVAFAYITGWRVTSEILPLEWRQVDFDGGEIRLDAGTTKNREGRVFPMTDDLRELLDTLYAEHDQRRRAGQIVPWVFVRLVADTRGGVKRPRRIVAFSKAWKNATVAAGCPGRIPHDFRRTAVRNMVRRGVPERVAMKMTGHKTRSIFERYNIVSDGDLRAAAEQLRGLMGTKKGQSPSEAPAASGQSAVLLREFGGAARI